MKVHHTNSIFWWCTFIWALMHSHLTLGKLFNLFLDPSGYQAQPKQWTLPGARYRPVYCVVILILRNSQASHPTSPQTGCSSGPQREGWGVSEGLPDSGEDRLDWSYQPSPTSQVDPMSDIANLSYGALPERLYIVLDGTIVYEVGQVLTDPM